MNFKSIIEGLCSRRHGSVAANSSGTEVIVAPPKNPLFDPAQFRMASYGRSVGELPNGKLVVFGLPKCGNVWLVSMLSDYLGLPAIDPMVEIQKSGVGMCHLPLAQVEHRADFIQAVYLMRDIRDVVVSYFHNCQTAWFKDNMPNFHYDDLESFYFEWFLPRVAPFHGIDDHASQYSSAGVPVVRYERLCADTAAEFIRLIKRLGLPLDQAAAERVVEKNRMEELQKKGRQLNVFVPSTHFRRGGAGGYKEELPPIVLRHINKSFGDLLVNWGYELDECVVGSTMAGGN